MSMTTAIFGETNIYFETFSWFTICSNDSASHSLDYPLKDVRLFDPLESRILRGILSATCKVYAMCLKSVVFQKIPQKNAFTFV